MAGDNPLLQLGVLAISIVLAKWWYDDFQLVRRRTGPLPDRLFPGTTPASGLALGVAVAGSITLLAIETGGEYALGISGQQSRMTALFAVGTLAAAFTEELIFRGYLVITNRGRGALMLGIMGASLLFALLHPFLWTWTDAGLVSHAHEPKAWFSTAMVFAGSLWFYAVRFLPINPTHSLLPCMAAHAAKNIGVIAIKYAQGFLGGWW